MFGNNDQQGYKPSWGEALLNFGLSTLANNNGRMTDAQLFGNAGLDALSAIQHRKMYEDKMARQREEDERKAQSHDLAMKQGQIKIDDAERQAQLEQAPAAGDEDAIKALAPLEWWKTKQQQAANELAYRRALDVAHIRAGGGRGGDYLPVDASARKELFNLGAIDEQVDNLINVVESSPASTGLIIGSLPQKAANMVDPEGLKVRSAIANFTSQVMNALSGAAVSEQERKRLEKFLPNPLDSKEDILTKMDEYRSFIKSKAGAWASTYGPHRRVDDMKAFKTRERKKADDKPAYLSRKDGEGESPKPIRRKYNPKTGRLE